MKTGKIRTLGEKNERLYIFVICSIVDGFLTACFIVYFFNLSIANTVQYIFKKIGQKRVILPKRPFKRVMPD